MTPKVNVLAYLEQVVQRNTQHYQSDFVFDQSALYRAAREANMEDRVFCWMSRPAGTWCVKEREVFLRGSNAHSIWTYYADTPERICAYRITVTGLENGKVMGRVVPLDYGEQVRRVQARALPVKTVTLRYESGYTITIPYDEYHRSVPTILPRHGGVQSVRYEPESEGELARVLMEEHRIQTGTHKKYRAKRKDRPER